MVLGTVRQEAEPHERWPKMLKGELENNPRKPRELVLVLVLENWHSDCLKKGSLVFLRVR
jgi:hypothetical protein